MTDGVAWKPVLIITAVAFVLRVVWILTQTAVIENEGGEYARIAENLLRGNGYVGTQGWPQLTYGPLFPWLIAAVTILTRNSEVAGRCVTLVFGTLFVLPIYLICCRVHGRSVAHFAALIVALHPLLIGYSAAVYNETVFLTVLMVGIYWGLRCLELKTPRHGVVAGLAFGLAYLSRVEALVYPLLTSLSIMLFCVLLKKELKQAIQTCLLLLVAFLIVAAPYVAFLSLQVGRLCFEAKGKMNYTIGMRIQSGLSQSQAQLGISRDLKEEGPLLDEHRFADFSPYPTNPRNVVSYVFAAARRNKDVLYQYVLPEFAIGSPILLALTLVGLFSKPWDRPRLVRETYLLAAVGFILSVLLLAHFIQFRYALPLLPFLIIWAARGIVELSEWAVHTTAHWCASVHSMGSQIANVVPMLLTTALIGIAALGVFHDGVLEIDMGRANVLPLKRAGLWLRSYMPGPKTIMDSRTCIPYYADGIMVYLPEAPDADVTLRYIHRKHPNFIVLSDLSRRAYLIDWLNKGVPDSNAQLVYETGTESQMNRVRIYRWTASHRS